MYVCVNISFCLLDCCYEKKQREAPTIYAYIRILFFTSTEFGSTGNRNEKKNLKKID